jgi:hypothetical protein
MDWADRVALDAARLIPTQRRVVDFAKRIDEKFGPPEARGRIGFSSSAFLDHLDKVLSSVSENAARDALVLTNAYVQRSALETLSLSSELNTYLESTLAPRYQVVRDYVKTSGHLSTMSVDAYIKRARDILSEVTSIEKTLPSPAQDGFVILVESGLQHLEAFYELALGLEKITWEAESSRAAEEARTVENEARKVTDAQMKKLSWHSAFAAYSNLWVAIAALIVGIIMGVVTIAVMDKDQVGRLRPYIGLSSGHASKPPSPAAQVAKPAVS